ncbi:hypothetical protein D3C72_1662870 [compost metagenome]
MQHGTRVDVVVPQLRAAVGVAEQEHAVGAFGIVRLFQKTVLNLTRNPVHAADGWQDPQFVADPDFSAGATVDLDVTICPLPLFSLKIRLIAVLVQIAEIGAGIVGMNMFTRRNIRQRMTDRQTILHHVFAFGDGEHGKFMPANNRLTQGDGLVFHGHFRAFTQIRQRYGNVIQRMDLDVLHINLKRP